MTLGLDHAGRPADYPGFVRAAKALGYSFEMRYLCDPGARPINADKLARPEEVQVALAAGLEVGLVWQNTKLDGLRGAPGGCDDATMAVRQAEELGYPYGSTIYFAIADYDAPVSDYPTLESYLHAVRSVTTMKYLVGVYGKRAVVEHMQQIGLADHVWQAWPWGGQTVGPAADVFQRHQQVTVAGTLCDVNEAFRDIGAWKRGVMLPGFEYIDCGPDGGTWATTTRPFRGVLHTTEGSFDAAIGAFRANGDPPHFTADPVHRRKAQHVELGRSSYALKNLPGGVETNRVPCIQIEVVGFARDSYKMTRDQLEWLGQEVIKPIVGQVPIANHHPAFYDDRSGFQLTRTDSPQRMTYEAWNAFNGWCGHQHVPENVHWDPGMLDLDIILAAAYGAGPRQEEDVHPTDITAKLATPSGKGYWLLQYDGGIQTKGDAAFYGSYPGLPPASRQDNDAHRGFFIIEARPDGGYDLTSTDGGTYGFPKK